MKEDIKILTEAYGPSGSEQEIKQIIRRKIKGYVDRVWEDTLGNLIAEKGRKGAKVMIAAHMDEIGLVVTHIDNKGFLRFAPVGGVSPLVLLGQRVVSKDKLTGTIGEEKRESPKDELKIDKMYIDIGATNAEEAKKKVSIGDIFTFEANFVDLGRRLIAKSFDDRIGCAVLIEVIKKLKRSPNHLYFVFTIQEEVGVRGATTSAYGLSPDAGVVVDVTGTGDTPEAKTMAVELGKGPAIKVLDRGHLAHPVMRKLLIEIARKKRIPYQLEVLERGTTDAMAIQSSREGVPTGVISVPTRFVHTPSEMVDINDVENAVKLLLNFLSLDFSKINFVS